MSLAIDQELSDRKLSEYVESHEMPDPAGGDERLSIGIGARAVARTWLPKLRERRSGARVLGMYDPINKKWRYCAPANPEADR